jgi:hypothetical protein
MILCWYAGVDLLRAERDTLNANGLVTAREVLVN